MTRSATQVGLRRVESCLGGHEEGVFRVDEGVKKTSLPLRKGDEWAGQKVPPSDVLPELKMILSA